MYFVLAAVGLLITYESLYRAFKRPTGSRSELHTEAQRDRARLLRQRGDIEHESYE